MKSSELLARWLRRVAELTNTNRSIAGMNQMGPRLEGITERDEQSWLTEGSRTNTLPNSV